MSITSFSINKRCQNVLVVALRAAFAENSDYPFVAKVDGSTDIDNTGIAIYRTYPKVMPSYPVILVETPSIDNMPRTFGHDIIREVREIDPISLVDGVSYSVYGGVANLSCTVSVHARTTAEREDILDWVITYLRHTQVDYIESQAIDIVDIRRTPETIQVYGSDFIYKSNISSELTCEWERIVTWDGYIIEDISLNINTILPDGTTVSDI